MCESDKDSSSNVWEDKVYSSKEEELVLALLSEL